LDQAVGSADLAVVVVVVEAHADHVAGSVVVVFLEAEADELVEAHADHVTESVVVEVEVFTDGVETTQTWVEVTVGAQLAGST
jgi:hypothetical protein